MSNNTKEILTLKQVQGQDQEEKIITIDPQANSLSMIRTKQTDKQIEGELFVLDPNGKVLFQCYTLELPWRGNQQRISSIAPGRYRVSLRYSNKYGWHLHILDVDGRSLILIHNANYVHQLEGCIAVGKSRKDLNNDGLMDVTSSVATLSRLIEFIKGPSLITIS